MTQGTVVAGATMSLDGYMAGPGHTMDWVFEYSSPAEYGDVIEATGAMLAGRNTYDVGQRDAGKPSGDAYGGAWSGPVFVLTHRPPGVPPGGGPTFLSGDIAEAVATARAAAGGRNLEVLGANVVAQCLARGLIDEILVHVAPTLLGGGVRFFGDGGPGRIKLELVNEKRRGQVTSLRYRVLR